MLVPFEFRVDEPELRRLLIKHFPEISEEVEEDAGLVHLQIGTLARLANSAIKSGEFELLNKTYEFIHDLSRHQKELSPEIINAIHVSFLEHLNFGNKNNGASAKEMLPPIMLKMWEAQMEHNRKIGWLK